MSDKQKKFYLTTPIYYVNARPHIGHAYTTLVADTIARRHRLLGDDTFFLTGTDEHGQKIERSAAAAGIAPQQFTDEVSNEFRQLWARMGLTNDDFIRTTEPRHQQGAQRLFALLHQRGQIYLSSYTGQYSIGEEIFVEGPPGVLGPDGKPTETVTEENFFFRLSEYQLPLLDLIESDTLLIQPESRKNEVLSFLRGPISAHLLSAKAATKAATEAAATKAADANAAAIGNATILTALTSSESTPFGLQVSGEAALIAAIGIGQAAEEAAHEAAAAAHTKASTPTSPAVILSEAKNPRISPEAPTMPAEIAYSKLGNPYVPGALRDLSVSRSSFTWGIPVPEPAASETKQKHVIYVWLDALANYMTAVGYGSDKPEDVAKFENYWPANLHIMAKEITRQHCIYWPAFLLALNPKLQHNPGEPTPKLSPDEHRAWAEKMLPKAVVAHGWLLFDDSKMSKSKGNIVRTETILDAFGTEVYEREFPDAESEGTQRWILNPDQALAYANGTLQTSNKRERDLFAADVLRYFLLREVSFGQDGSFSFEAMWARYDAELGSKFGNLVKRTLKLIQADCESLIPPYFERKRNQLLIGRKEAPVQVSVPELYLAISSIVTVNGCAEAYESLRFTSAKNEELSERQGHVVTTADQVGVLDWVLELISQANTHLSHNAPWKLLKSDDAKDIAKAHDILYEVAETIRIIAALLYPILPYATASVWRQLGLGDIEQAAKNGDLKNLEWGGLKPGTKLGPLSPIFPRADKGLAQIMTDMENPTKPTPAKFVGESTSRTQPVPTDTTDPGAPPRTSDLIEPNPGAQVGASWAPIPELIKTPHHTESPASEAFAASAAASTTPDTPQICIEDFVKIDLRVAQIVVAERIPKADKLLRLEVDLGYEKRQILSGIAEWYTPEELLGRRIVVITNLAPRKMRGLDSHGMLLAASAGENGKPILATFSEDIVLGSRLK